ncbi:hypothetical protein ATCM_03835 [Stenotrophomonas sp. ATCM1_4]|uniref:hypothetical protein n=1 Tax=Stenotrophomonas sp. ATCM1_4 TaxID=2259330 RepID=UPI00104B6949|nr:hypothetical protein [Stenotrophomonas sp. ATCM1_4]TDB26846.1 hypothetical protein ATCM_03835 [Stenotrophomonas sp. ATCM1_4]
MRIDHNEPDTTTVEDDGTAAAAAQAAATVASNDGATDTGAMDAFSQGVEVAREQEVREEGGAPAAAADGQAAAGAEVDAAGGETVGAAAPAGGAEGGQGGEPDAAAAAAAASAASQPDAIDAEIKDLGINNERTQKRFRELSERAAEVEALRPDAERGRQWEETIKSTGADPQQMGNALNYLAAINSGDPAAMGQAYDFMQQEMAWLAKQLGRPAPGYDPLSEHADLAKQVADGDMTRPAAEELIRSRRTTALQQDSQQRQRQQMEQQATAEQAHQQALQQVGALGQQLRAADPHFDAKFKAIQPMVAVIQSTLPPQEWAGAIQRAYLAAPAPVVAPPAQRQPAAAPNNPARATGLDLSQAPTKENAFTFGVAAAKAQGR